MMGNRTVILKNVEEADADNKSSSSTICNAICDYTHMFVR
jgi:hypothetical protein